MRAPNIARSPRKFRKRYVLVPLALAMLAYIFMLESDKLKSILPAAGQNEVVSEGDALIGGTFTLVNTKGEQVTEKNLIGDKYTLLFFGFSHCPDVCPAMLQMVGDMYHKLPADVSSKLTPVFVSIDPSRDTPEDLAEYVSQFDAGIEAWSGTEAQIKQIKDAYLVYATKRLYEDGSDGY
ncbi:MAG: hypothetical protein COY40_02155, partial [Alphaproteobacteria bacterium CG_4_10_14_0_8_um_filter_53_9]